MNTMALVFTTFALFMVTIVVSYIFYQRIKMAQSEYEESKGLVTNVTSAFTREVKKMETDLERLERDTLQAKYMASEAISAKQGDSEATLAGLEKEKELSDRVDGIEESIESMKKDLVKFISEEQFDNHIRIADYFTTSSSAPYIMALGTRNADEALRTWKSNQEFLRGPGNKPIMDFTGFDTLEYLRGGEVAIQHLLDAVAKIKISKDLGIGILKPGLRLTQEIMNMADTYFRVVEVDGAYLLYGKKPRTRLYNIEHLLPEGTPEPRLIPIV